MGTSQPKIILVGTGAECLESEPVRGWPLPEDLVIRAQKPFRFRSRAIWTMAILANQRPEMGRWVQMSTYEE
jgi:hypothetical protein